MRFPLSIFSFSNTVIDALLPHSCLLCGAAAHAALCAGCTADLPRLTGPGCPRCAAPLPTPAPTCGDCLHKPPVFNATHAALRYTYPVDHLVQALKFRHRLAVADFFARCLLASPPPAGDLILPVPLSPQRLRERGFNQAMEIARPLANALDLPLDTASLIRIRETAPQSMLPWRVRHDNVRHAFACHADLSGKSIIVVDDVITTGATLNAVAQALKDHGAVRVTNWVVARTVKTLT
jgi:ComF family protein